MAAIEIRELGRLADGRFEVGVRFGGGEEHAAVVGDPFAPEDEALLAWYFEEHLKFPFTRGVDAAKAAASVRRYGEALFEQLFAGREAYIAYGREVERGVESLAWGVTGADDSIACTGKRSRIPACRAPSRSRDLWCGRT